MSRICVVLFKGESMSERKFVWDDGAMQSTLALGPWFATATSSAWSIQLDDAGKVRSGYRNTRADCKAAVEAALRLMLPEDESHAPVAPVAPVAADVPVLRWVEGDDYGGSGWKYAGARLGVWTLRAHVGTWSVAIHGMPIADGRSDGLSLPINKASAEAALRALGVVFRVEGES